MANEIGITMPSELPQSVIGIKQISRVNIKLPKIDKINNKTIKLKTNRRI